MKLKLILAILAIITFNHNVSSFRIGPQYIEKVQENQTHDELVVTFDCGQLNLEHYIILPSIIFCIVIIFLIRTWFAVIDWKKEVKETRDKNQFIEAASLMCSIIITSVIFIIISEKYLQITEHLQNDQNSVTFKCEKWMQTY